MCWNSDVYSHILNSIEWCHQSDGAFILFFSSFFFLPTNGNCVIESTFSFWKSVRCTYNDFYHDGRRISSFVSFNLILFRWIKYLIKYLLSLFQIHVVLLRHHCHSFVSILHLSKTVRHLTFHRLIYLHVLFFVLSALSF